mgnify:CR=1 FL=1
MKAIRIIFISNVFFLISACSQLLTITGSGEAQLNRLLDDHRYQQALLLIDGSNPKHPEHSLLLSRRSDVARQQQQHINNAIKQSQHLAQQKQWPQAEQLLKTNIEKNSNNKALQQALTALNEKKQQFVAQQKLTLAEHNANTLPSTLYITEQLLLAQPNNKTLLEQQQTIIAQINSAAEYLEQQVNSNINKQQWGSARRYLHAYQKIKGRNSLPKAKLLLEQQQQKIDNQQQRKSAQDTQLRLKQQQQALQQALTNKDWSQVKNLLTTLESSREQLPSIAQLIDDTTKHMQRLGSTLIQQGQRHYTHGRIDQAINSWQQALEINPDDNDLKERLQRALRFQTNIEKLQ